MQSCKNKIVRTFTTLIATGALLTGISQHVSAQTIYEWQDSKGERNYSDVPPEDVAVRSTGINIKPTDPTEVQARLGEKREANAATAEANQKAAAEKAKQDAVDKENQAMMDANCEQAKSTLKAYMSNRRIYKQGKNGEVEWLDIDEERASAQEQVDKWCK